MAFAGDDLAAADFGSYASDEGTDSDDLGGVSSRKRRRDSETRSVEESRRMFQKLWTDADEMKVLQGFLEFTSKRGTTHANYQHDTGPFFDEIRPRLQFEFNKNQIVEKLRRLKKKYRNAAARIGSGRGFVFKSPHDRATYEISRKIWSSTFSRKPKNTPPPADSGPTRPDQSVGVTGGSEEALVPVAVMETSAGLAQGYCVAVSSVTVPLTDPPTVDAASVVSSTEEAAVKICLAPLFKELVQFAVSGAVTAAPPMWLPPLGTAVDAAEEGDERWRRQRILELELYLKRMELVEECVRTALEKLRSTGS